MASVTLFGQAYPLEYTIMAQSIIAQRFGSIEKLDTEIEGGGVADMMDNVTFIMAALLKGGEQRERARCKLTGEEYAGKPAPAYEDLLAVLTPLDAKGMMAKCMEVMTEAAKTTVEVEPEKNGGATPSK